MTGLQRAKYMAEMKKRHEAKEAEKQGGKPGDSKPVHTVKMRRHRLPRKVSYKERDNVSMGAPQKGAHFLFVKDCN